MNSVEAYDSGWAAWWRKHSTSLQVRTIFYNIAYLMDTGYTPKAATLSMILLGGASLYCFFSRRRKINARDLIVITGCNSGLGYSLAIHCRAKGAMVLAGVRETAMTNPNAAVEVLKNKGVIIHHLDITNEQSTRDFQDKVKSLLKERQLVLRALVNNAGVMVFGEFEWQTQNLAEHQINVNLLGTMRITRELMPILRENRSRIIVISSHCADEPLPGISIYGATKAALHAWATSLRVEVGKYGVEVVSFIRFIFSSFSFLVMVLVFVAVIISRCLKISFSFSSLLITTGGFVSQSNIMKRQRLHFDEMRQHMSDEAKRFYGNYFTRYAEYFSLASPTENQGNIKVLSDPRIYETFDHALLDIYPSAVYRCEPWRYFFYRILFKNTPMWMRDRLVQRFVVVPPWQADEQ